MQDPWLSSGHTQPCWLLQSSLQTAAQQQQQQQQGLVWVRLQL
jgi:hypothetical protein